MRKYFILAIMALSGLPSHAYDFVTDGIYYNITSESGLTVEVTYSRTWEDVGYSYPYRCSYNGNIKIPETVTYNGKEYLVTGIGAHAFETSLSSDLSTYMTKLKSIKMPSSIKYIGESAFSACDALSSMIIPSSVEEIGATSFWCRNCKTFIFLSAIPPKVNGTGYQGYPLCIPGEIIVPQAATYLADSKWNSKKDGFYWGGVVEMLSSNASSFIYNGQDPSPIWTNNLKTYTVSISAPSMQKDAGSYSTVVKADYYKNEVLDFSVEFSYEYTINKAFLNVKANNASRLYGDDDPPFTFTYSGFVNGESESSITASPVISTSAKTTSKVGEYPITISGGSAKNYKFVYESGTLTITKAPLSAKVKDVTKVYGSLNPTFTIEYYGLKNGETKPAWTISPTFSTTADKNSNVGQYEVIAVNAVPTNYNLGEITSGTLNVVPAPLTIKAVNASRQYYSDEPNFSYTCTGFVNGENESVLTNKPTLSTSATQTSNVGTYEIKVGETSSPNYSILKINGTLTITPRILMVSVENHERLYNEDNPAFEIKYDGFVNNENETVLSAKPIASTTAIKSSDVGTYPINVTGGSADNYIFSYISGTLTINKAEQFISWEQDLGGLKVGDQVLLKAEASSGLPIVYTMDNNNTAEIYSAGTKQYLDCKAGGQFSIRAIQNGNKNFYSSPKAYNIVSIIGSNPTSDPILTIKQADNGSINVQITKGSVYTFNIAPSKGWRIHSVTYNNIDVTSQLSNDGRFVTPVINDNSILSVVYEEDTSAISAARVSDVQIRSTLDGVRVLNANTGDLIRVYTTGGVLHKSVKVNSQEIDIPLPEGDVYIIKVDGKTVKLSH